MSIWAILGLLVLVVLLSRRARRDEEPFSITDTVDMQALPTSENTPNLPELQRNRYLLLLSADGSADYVSLKQLYHWALNDVKDAAVKKAGELINDTVKSRAKMVVQTATLNGAIVRGYDSATDAFGGELPDQTTFEDCMAMLRHQQHEFGGFRTSVQASVRKKYAAMNLTQLFHECTKAGVDPYGTKEQIVARMVAKQKPATGWDRNICFRYDPYKVVSTSVQKGTSLQAWFKNGGDPANTTHVSMWLTRGDHNEIINTYRRAFPKSGEPPPPPPPLSPPPACANTPGFKDKFGFACASWRGYGTCTRQDFPDWQGYTDQDLLAVQTNCKETCQRC